MNSKVLKYIKEYKQLKEEQLRGHRKAIDLLIDVFGEKIVNSEEKYDYHNILNNITYLKRDIKELNELINYLNKGDEIK